MYIDMWCKEVWIVFKVLKGVLGKLLVSLFIGYGGLVVGMVSVVLGCRFLVVRKYYLVMFRWDEKF